MFVRFVIIILNALTLSLHTNIAKSKLLEYTNSDDPTFGGNYSYLICSQQYSTYCSTQAKSFKCTPLNETPVNVAFINISEKRLCFNAKLDSCEAALTFDATSSLREDYGEARLLLATNVDGIFDIDINFPFSDDPWINYAFSSPYPNRKNDTLVQFGKCRRVMYKDLFRDISQRAR